MKQKGDYGSFRLVLLFVDCVLGTDCSINSCHSVSILPHPRDRSRNAFTQQPVKILKRQPVSDPCLAASNSK